MATKNTSRPVCYADAPNAVIGYACTRCMSLYTVQEFGREAEKVAQFCCDHACWECGARATAGQIFCTKCGIDGEANLKRGQPKPVDHVPTKKGGHGNGAPS